jgi:hypothetical protein
MGWSTKHEARPGEPGYVPIDEFVRRELARRAAFEALPSTIAKRAIEREVAARLQAERDAGRKRKRFVQSTDYPWLKPDWKW